MAFLRTLFWIAVTIVVVIFSLRNWTTVTLDLFGGLRADAKLPVLLIGAFLLGFLPVYAWHRVLRWRHRRRVAELTRATQPASPPPLSPPPSDPTEPVGAPLPTLATEPM